MNTKVRSIEVDEATANALKERAEKLGMSVPELLAQYVGEDRSDGPVDQDQIAELDRRWAASKSGATAVPHDQVVRWLDTWGTAAYRPWRDQ